MAAFKRGVLFLPPMQRVRCRSKVNIQHPKPRHDPRRLFEAITKPVYLPQTISPVQKCAKKYTEIISQVQEENPYEEFLQRQCQRLLEENIMVAVCQALPMTAQGRKAARNMLLSQGMTLHFYSNSLMKRGVKSVGASAMEPWLTGSNLYVASDQPRVQDLVKTLRKIPELILLGAKIDNYLLSREGLNQMAKLPPLEQMQGELLTILGASASRTRSLLGRHQLVLADTLDRHIKQCQDTATS